MDSNFFSQRVDAFQKRVTSLFDHLQNPDNKQNIYIQESFIELVKALEELETAEEELNVQATALEQFREQAEVEHDNYLGLLQFCPDGYLITDRNGTIRLANPAACRMLNKAMQFLVGKPLINWILESDRKAFRSQLNRVTKEGTIQNFEMRISLRKQNTWSVIRFTAGPVRDALGDVVSIRWLLRDIQQYNELEFGLGTYRDRFKAVFQEVPVGIQLLDKNGHTLDANPAFQRLLGYDLEALKDLTFIDYIEHEDLERLVTLYTRLSQHDIDRFRIDVTLRTKTRGALPVRLSIARYKSASDPAGYAVATVEDRSEKVGPSQKVPDVQESVVKNSMVLRQSLAQDLKTGPLEDLALILHRLDNLTQPDSDQIGEIEEIRMALEYTIATLTEKVNDLATNRSVPFDLHEAITALMEQLKWENQSLTYTVDYDPVLHSMPESTRMALFNISAMILQNRFNQVRPSWFEVRAQRGQDTVILEIQDDGPGEKLPVLPETLIREGQFEYAQAIEQAETLHGHISFEGELNNRSTVRIVLPWKYQPAKDDHDLYGKSKQAASLNNGHANNKESNSKMDYEVPLVPPDNQRSLYIPYDKDQQLDQAV